MIGIYEEKEDIIKDLHEILEILFKDIDISLILDFYNHEGLEVYGYNNKFSMDFIRSIVPIEIFRGVAFKKFPYYSCSEIDNLYDAITEYLNKGNFRTRSIFNLILLISKCCLTEKRGQPVIRYNKALKWRMASLKLDQDLFIAIYLANLDLNIKEQRKIFNWNDVLKTDNINIQKILDKGIADNHYHLEGSAPHFNIAWISLMNSIVNRKKAFQDASIDKNRLEFNERRYSMYQLVILAATIRIYIYKTIIKGELAKNLNKVLNLKKIKPEKLELLINDIEFEIQSEKNVSFNKPKFDYFNDSIDIYSGEKKLLYLSIRKILEKGDSKFEKLFYIYTLIKSKFRSEIIQLNDRVGFKNFKSYQDRKSSFLKDKHEKNLLITESILRSIRNQNIVSLEARMIQSGSFDQITNQVNEADKYIADAIRNEQSTWNNSVVDNDKYILERIRNYGGHYIDENNIKDKLYYVFDYPKMKDKPKKLINGITQPRNADMRESLKIYANNLCKIREEGTVANRILGIDGCGNELNCRPEVFGTAFRYLKKYICKEQYLKPILPDLKITYHVGEEFLDIGDGLRSVEEAILFLEMSEGDRIGHGMVLGIDISKWYYQKKYKIIITKQSYLDNLAWILHKIKKYDIPNKFKYYSFLEPIFKKIYSEVYGGAFVNQNILSTNITDDVYYLSWLLRGDNPEMYITGEFVEPSMIKFWNKCGLSHACKTSVRDNKDAAMLYKLYHYNESVKENGSQIITVDIDNKYIEVLIFIQKYLRELVASKGIALETNPSSNYLIGTFKRYDKHPITTFYSNNLFSREAFGSQMSTSINTDDQGIFNTYLENEYVLIALSLEKDKDIAGMTKYEKTMIYKWLDEIREMGLRQSFLEYIK